MFQFPPLPPLRPGHRQIVFAFVIVFALIEIACQLSDARVIEPGLRLWFLRHFSFFDPWFDAWLSGRPSPPQTPWSLLSYAFLHGGMTHMLMNSAAFLGLGLVTLRIFGGWLFLWFFLATAVGGALGFGLMSASDLPMIGASGVVFGLIGVLKCAEFAFITRQGGGSMRAFWSSIGGLVMINVILAVALGGLLAWQTHLGGFVAGWLVAWIAIPRR
jgi:rhomboid protease GluP